MKIENAHRNDAQEITELTVRSKNHWGYGLDQIERWREELTITPAYIDKNQVYKLVVDDEIFGFYAYRPENEKKIKLEFLFVIPNAIGKGYGKRLLKDFLKRLQNTQFESVTLDADPNAEEFYQQIGFNTVGKLESSIPGRFLPVMELKINSK